MAEPQWYFDEKGGFEIRLPEGWSVQEDLEEEGVELVDPREVGTLHLLGFTGDDAEPADPAEELYAFLEGQGIELQEDEIEDLELAGGAEMALCEFVSEGDSEEEEGPSYWLMGVAIAPGVLVFATYSCDAGEAEREREAVVAALRTLRLRGADAT